MTVSVFYTKRNYSAFDYNFDGNVMVRHYDNDGEFTGRDFLPPSIDMYTEVSTINVQDGMSNDDIFNYVVRSHNMGTYPERISDKIRSGKSEASHSSFSVGDIIRIGGCYYISTGYDFKLLPLNFSNDD